MEEIKGVIVLGRQDMTLESGKKEVKDITIYDVKGSLKPMWKAEMIFFVDSPYMKVLKCRYEIVE